MKGFFPKTVFGLTFLFAAIIFLAMIATVAVSAVAAFFIVESDLIPTTEEMVPIIFATCVVVFFVSLPVGVLLAVFMSKMPLRPIREMMDGMDKLASGDFHTRVAPGRLMRNYPALAALAVSFNKMAEQLDHTEVLRSDFINNFSHEFKTPIVSIAGFAKLLRRGNLTPEQQQEYLAIIEEESLRLSSMATNVLNMSKIENQTILTDTTAYNLSEQLRSCVLLLEDEWTRKELVLDMEFDEYDICANEELMRQVFINLIDNAVKFSPQGGAVCIDIRRDAGDTCVSISNTGPEIPAEIREKIFRKFYQGDESHASLGNGIGLAIVKRVVQLHGGSVGVECGSGVTTFTVRLPDLRTEGSR